VTPSVHTPPSGTDAAAGAPLASLRKVGKRFGKQWAIRDIDLTLSPGEIVGFIGPNGAGKTTLMRILAGLTAATEGEVTVMGERFGGRELYTPPGLGVMLEQMGFIPHLSGRGNLELFAKVSRAPSATPIVETLKEVGLDPEDRRAVRAYSLGMRQRLLLAQALMDRPRLLLLDEPTNGLDPAGIVDLRHLLAKIAGEGTAIFLASHLLTEVERICHRVLLVRAGQLLKEVDLRVAGPARVRVVVPSERDVERLLDSGLGAERVAGEPGSFAVVVTPRGRLPDLVREVFERGVEIEEIHREHPSLEREFLTLFR
jgi:ABC-type multidrug transport system ATPase subunit